MTQGMEYDLSFKHRVLQGEDEQEDTVEVGLPLNIS